LKKQTAWTFLPFLAFLAAACRPVEPPSPFGAVPTECNAVLIQEYIPLGQRVKAFSVEAFIDNRWIEIAAGTTIGNRRIVRFDTVITSQLRFNFDAKACPLISNIEVYRTQKKYLSFI